MFYFVHVCVIVVMLNVQRTCRHGRMVLENRLLKSNSKEFVLTSCRLLLHNAPRNYTHNVKPNSMDWFLGQHKQNNIKSNSVQHFKPPVLRWITF